MIRGKVNANREAIIPLTVVGPKGRRLGIKAVVDTGFTGSLTLPPKLIAKLKLSWLCRQPGMLADGSVDLFDVYVASVVWDGRARIIEVESADADPLVGMSLLYRHCFQVNVVVRGKVMILPLKRQ